VSRRRKMDPVDMIEREQMRTDLAPFQVGDTVNVTVRIKEGDKERLQAFKGVVIRKRKGQSGATFTVRKVSYGIGVERIFPMNSPLLEKIEVLSQARVRRSKLYYLRERRGKAARLKNRALV